MAPRADQPDDDSPVEPGADPAHPDDAPRDPTADLTDDERWAAIVAELTAGTDDEPHDPADAEPEPGPAGAQPVTFPVAPWVTGRRVVRPAHGTTPDDPPELDDAGPRPSGRDWDGTGQTDAAEARVDAEEHFVAPDPGPVLGGDPLLTMAWFATIGMPLFLLVVLVGWRDAPSALVQAAGAVFVLGVGVLVWRMPHRRDDSDDDSGAVV